MSHLWRVLIDETGAPPEDEGEASALAEERFQGFLEMRADEITNTV